MLQLKKLNDEYGDEVFNASDDFFNNPCFQFDDLDKDIALEERRLFYFQNISLCEKDCTYLRVD